MNKYRKKQNNFYILDEKLIDKLDKFCEKEGRTRSNALVFILNEFFNNER
jgi:hypothetical protein